MPEEKKEERVAAARVNAALGSRLNSGGNLKVTRRAASSQSARSTQHNIARDSPHGTPQMRLLVLVPYSSTVLHHWSAVL